MFAADVDLDIVAGRLSIAHQIVNQLWQHAPRHQPASPPDYDYARSWPWIPTGHQLVEQAFKLLLSIHWRVPPAQVRECFKHGSGHDLDALFDELPAADKGAIESSYRSFVDLHDYIPGKTASEFLNAVGQGYANWRYVLLEGWTDRRGEPDPRKAPPTNHIGALIEIAAVAITQAKFHLSGKPGRFPVVAERIDREIDDVVGHCCNRLHDGESDREDWDTRYERLHQLLVEHRHTIAAHLDNTDNPRLGPQPASNSYAQEGLPALPEELLPIVADLRHSRDRKNLFVYFCTTAASASLSAHPTLLG